MERIRAMMTVTVMVMTTMVMTVNGQQECVSQNGERGICGSISSCPVLQELLKTDIGKLRSYICAFSSSGLPRVCCPPPATQPVISQEPPPLVFPPQPSAVSGASLLPTTCGRIPLVDRIVGGGDAALMSWPWIALLGATDSQGRRIWFCGGVLISARYVLTAAHCVHSSSDFRLDTVRLGEHQLGVTPDCSSLCAPDPQDIQPSEVVVHEGYTTVPNCRFCHDIALIRLSTPARIVTNFVVPICISRDPLKDFNITNRDFTGRLGWVAGWGATHRVRHTQRSNVLQEVLLPISNEFCQKRSRYPDPSMVMCAGGEGRDSCRGDSGGPLVILNTIGTHYVVGVVSSGPSVCGASRTQGLYTNLDFYLQWVFRHLRP